mmetsp:Transcript_18415/g.44474  ORF Transcript_18415/g.44474 Transcript_18415/m.44474 type:complete len:473 (+) Transcript_18415:32-1450(+)
MDDRTEKDSGPSPILRTITGFVTFSLDDFNPMTESGGDGFYEKLGKVSEHLDALKKNFTDSSYTVQTLRIATNPWPEWLTVTSNATNCETLRHMNRLDNDPPYKKIIQERLELLDEVLTEYGIFACALGPGDSKIPCHSEICELIVKTSSKLSCSLAVDSTNHIAALKAADTIYNLSKIGEDQLGLSNFQFCVSSKTCLPCIPFFPVAYNYRLFDSDPVRCTLPPETSKDETYKYQFAIGLENGNFVQQALKECKTISRIDTYFRKKMTGAILPIQEIAKKYVSDEKFDKIEFIGVDTSLNPGLDPEGSIAAAIEQLREVSTFGRPGTIAAAAQLTTTIQSLEGIKRSGYCGLMLPVCEDQRLADLSKRNRQGDDDNGSNSGGGGTPLSIQHLLNVSSVCGVGIDTVPISGIASPENKQRLASLILDVVGLAERWKKPLTCRVFPVPNRDVGQSTNFKDFPHMVDAEVFDIC